MLLDDKKFESILGNRDKVLLITNRSLLQDSLYILKNKPMHYLIVSAEPTIDDLNNIFKEIEGYSFDIVVFVLDISKVVSSSNLFTNIKDDLSNKKLFKRICPSLCIPTTAGTGAEVTAFATIWNKKEKKKIFFSR